MSTYNVLYSQENNLYLEGAPVLIEKGVLFLNTENDKVHIQLKFKNLSNEPITMLKVNFVLMDSVGREIGCGEKQYIDLKAMLNESFGDQVPIFLTDNTARKFSATIKEVCFENGDIWTSDENAVWENIPNAQPISQKMTTKEAIEEFKLVYCKQAKFFPFTHKDLWVCACGNINKTSRECCCVCRAQFAAMTYADAETLKNDNIYRNASDLVNKKASSEISKGIAMFEKIPNWKDSARRIEVARQKINDNIYRNASDLVNKKASSKISKGIAMFEKIPNWKDSARRIEEAKQKLIVVSKREKRDKIIVVASCVSVVVVIIGICVGNLIYKSNKYNQATAYLEQNSFEQAAELFKSIAGYKDAENLYLYSKDIQDGNYGEIVKREGLVEFTIPNGITSIGKEAFEGCETLISITIPNSVTSIGESAFAWCARLTGVNYTGTIDQWAQIEFDGYYANPLVYAYNLYINNELVTEANITTATKISNYAFWFCGSLTSVIIPDSVTSIGESAFSGCSSLTNITYKGTMAQWKAISKDWAWTYNTPSTLTITCSDGKLDKYGDKIS